MKKDVAPFVLKKEGQQNISTGYYEKKKFIKRSLLIACLVYDLIIKDICDLRIKRI